jgi:hypothetical protein
MIKIVKFAVLMVFLLNCENRLCGCDPVPKILQGSWKLIQIDYGYPIPNMPSFTRDVEDQVYEFDETKSSFKVYKNSKIVESGKYLFTEDMQGKKIEFLTNNTYSILSFNQNNKELILYERAPKGAVLADGNSYRYLKIE